LDQRFDNVRFAGRAKRSAGKMPKYLQFSVSHADLPKAHPDFSLRRVGLEDSDLDLTKAKVWVDDVLMPAVRQKDHLIVKAPLSRGRPRTIAVTTGTGKLIGILQGNKLPPVKEAER
jgi:hypothetical protein